MTATIQTDDGQTTVVEKVEKVETDFAKNEVRVYIFNNVLPMKFEGVENCWVLEKK